MKLQDVLSLLSQYWPLAVAGAAAAAAMIYSDLDKDRYHETSQHHQAMHPRVPKQYLRKVPEGLILGKVGNRYYCIPEGRDDSDCMSVLIWGGSGSGKTSGPIGCSVLQLQYDLITRPDDAWTAMICDLKGEIHELVGGSARACTDPNDSDPSTFYLIDPLEENRTRSVGWDPYYRLHMEENPSYDLQIEVFTGIAKCFIAEDKKNAYFTENATAMMCGCMAYGFSRGENIVDTMRRILACNLPEEIERELADSAPDSLVSFFLGKFRGNSSEGYEDICSTMTSKLSCLALESSSWVLRDCPTKIGPDAVRRKIVFLSVPDHMLTETQMAPIFRLIISQEMQYLTLKIPQKGTRPVVLMIDEAYAIAPSGLPNLEKTLSICRGYRFSMVLAFQGQSQLDAAYGQGNGSGARIILDNMRARCVLEVSDKKSAEMCVSWAGKFHERNTSLQKGRKASSTVSWQEKDIFSPSDFTTLATKKKVYVNVPTGFYLIQKLQWFKDKHFVAIHDTLHFTRKEADHDV